MPVLARVGREASQPFAALELGPDFRVAVLGA